MANFCQSYFYYKLETLPEDILKDGWINQRERAIYDKAIEAVYRKFGRHVIYITDYPFDNNFFSYTGPDAAVITAADWSEKFAPPSLTAFLTREMVLATICLCANVTDEDIDRISRDPSIGCLFDFCNDKSDVRFGLVAGYLSLPTKSALRHRVTQPVIDAAEKILELIRLYSIGKPFITDSSEAFVVMKFSERDENANAYEHGIRPALTEFGLIPKRADQDPRMKILSQKVLEHIDKCRLVVIKVDELKSKRLF